MDWLWYVLVGFLCLLGGLAIGFFIARKTMMNYMKKNPPINEQMLRVMMMQMGQNPSQKKINQMMKAMQNQQETSNKKGAKKNKK
ncbi:YneF family protein [Salsuginibacillus kocurii]|uniref:YneF family protein n=1 Tax=Salsuginibacillus kocurii TaxID=427078 RepID=UPI0003745B2A|nr:YneF family protein [Salsuginibacillus kocurii]